MVIDTHIRKAVWDPAIPAGIGQFAVIQAMACRNVRIDYRFAGADAATRAHRERPRGRRAADKRYKLSPSHCLPEATDRASYRQKLVHWKGPPMSALGQKQTFAVQKDMSALPPKADIRRQSVLCHKRTFLPTQTKFQFLYRSSTATDTGGAHHRQ
jgi:hypothetical protein